MNLDALQKTIHANATEKGWNDNPLAERQGLGSAFTTHVHTDRVLAKLALMHTELCEAEVEYLAQRFDVCFDGDNPEKPGGYVVELADAVICSLNVCESLGLRMGGTPSLKPEGETLHSYVSAATEAARDGDYTGRFVRALAGLRHACLLICEAKGLDLHAAIELKIAYNRTRSHMHGGRLA